MKPLYVKKNGVVYKISGNGMPASYPAANVEYDNTVTSELQATDVQGAIDELSTREAGVQSDWNEDDSAELDYIKNKPQNLVQDASYVHTDNNYDATAKGKVDALGTAASKNVPTSGNASTTEVVMGDDTRLTDARSASDVSAWAKASTKPTYTASEVGAIASTLKGSVNGVAELDAAGKVPSSQLPSFVDDVIEVADYDHLPITGESGKIYVTLDTNKTYRWTGSGYVEISESLALGETSSTAYRGDRGKTAYDHSQDTGRITTAVSSGLYKFSATAQGHISGTTEVQKSDITALGIPAQDTTYGVVSKTANGLAPQLPNETTTTKYLRQDGTWQVPPDNNTTYTFAGGTNKITVTPSGGTAQDVTITASDSTKLPLAGGNMTGAGGIQFPTASGSSKPNNYISAGGGYSTASGKSGVKLIVCEQSDCVSGLGQDCGGGPYELSIITGANTDGSTRIRFLKHTVAAPTTYTKLAELDGNGNFSCTYLNGVAIGSSPKFTDTTYNFAGTTFVSGGSNTGTHDANSVSSNGSYWINTNAPTSIANGTYANDSTVMLFSSYYSNLFQDQIAMDSYNHGALLTRSMSNGSWSSWYNVFYGCQWTATVKANTWSRICYVTPRYAIEGSSAILAITGYRGSYVTNNLFLISINHNDHTYSNIKQINGGNYTQYEYRFVSNSNGYYYIELKDTSDQSYHCSFLMLSQASITTYTSFTDGTTVPTNFTDSDVCKTNLSARFSNAEGNGSRATGLYSHAEGHQTTAFGDYSHSEGYQTSSGYASHAEGYLTTASSYYSHSEGYKTHASASSHAEGYYTTASGYYSHSEGYQTAATSSASHAEGHQTTAEGTNSHTEGYQTFSANYSHAEGYQTISIGNYSHTEGSRTTAFGGYSHAEGYRTSASGNYSHAEGDETTASGVCSHTEGIYTTASNANSHALGHRNAAMTNGGSATNTSGTAFVIGNGTASNALKNAFSVQFNGVVKAASTITASTTADYAEYFEWADENPQAEDRVGYFVTFDNGDKIRFATSEDDYILGVTSGEPFVLGNGDCDVWNGMVLRDEFRRIIYEPAPDYIEIKGGGRIPHLDKDGNPVYNGTRPKLNPNYDPTKPYINRADRPEWCPVGMLGVLAVRDDGTCEVNGYATITDNAIATKYTGQNQNKYRVIHRNAQNVVEIVFR